MKIDFSKGKVTLVVCPVDMRCGYEKLSFFAREMMGIDVDRGGQYVVFISRSRKMCKIIFADDRGRTLITRWLHDHRYQLIKTIANTVAAQPLEAKLLERYLDGEDILVARENFLKN